MSDSQLGGYTPPIVDTNKPQEAPKIEDEEFNLLDIDFNIDDQDQNISHLDESNSIKSEDIPKMGKGRFVDNDDMFVDRVRVEENDDINTNSGNQNLKPNLVNEDLEENQPKIVENRSL